MRINLIRELTLSMTADEYAMLVEHHGKAARYVASSVDFAKGSATLVPQKDKGAKPWHPTSRPGITYLSVSKRWAPEIRGVKPFGMTEAVFTVTDNHLRVVWDPSKTHKPQRHGGRVAKVDPANDDFATLSAAVKTINRLRRSLKVQLKVLPTGKLSAMVEVKRMVRL